jgi:hypothetical protein
MGSWKPSGSSAPREATSHAAPTGKYSCPTSIAVSSMGLGPRRASRARPAAATPRVATSQALARAAANRPGGNVNDATPRGEATTTRRRASVAIAAGGWRSRSSRAPMTASPSGTHVATASPTSASPICGKARAPTSESHARLVRATGTARSATGGAGGAGVEGGGGELVGMGVAWRLRPQGEVRARELPTGRVRKELWGSGR